MGSPTRYACYGKEMLGWIYEKMATHESALGGGKYSAFGSTVIGNGALAYNDPCAPWRDYSTHQPGGRGPAPFKFSPHNVE
jgi:hypothetical protein